MKNKLLNTTLNITYLILTLLTIYCLLIYIIDTNLFKISKIKIRGNEFIADNDVLKLIEDHKYNILNVDKDKIRKNIKDNIYINDVKIYTEIPNKLIIEIKEITPIALTEINNNYYFLDNYSKLIIANIESINFFSAPIITNISNKTINFQHSKKLLSSIFNYKENLYNKLNEIIYTNDYITLIFINNTKVQLRRNRYKNDIDKLYGLLNQIKSNEIQSYKDIDLSINKLIFVNENKIEL